MHLTELAKNSFKILKANKSRTFLTMLGIVIGISAVIVIMSVGAGAQSLILDQINSIGTDLVSVTPGFTDQNGPPAMVYGIFVTTLKKSDADALSTIPEVVATASYVEGSATVTYQNEKIDTKIVGTTAEYSKVEDIEFDKGGVFEKSDEQGISRVALLGWQIAQDLFGDADPIGQKIKISKETFRVVGVIKKRGAVGFENQDSIVVVPLETAQKIIFGINYLHAIVMKSQSETDVEYIISQTKDIIRERHDIDNPDKDDFTIYTTASFLETLENITNALRFFLSAIAAISLLVGGVGIMNIMLVSVNERTREIGLRKAVGATPENIQNQFLVEAAVLTFIGGTIGVIFGIAFSGLIAVVAHALDYTWEFVVTIPSILIGVGISALVGIVFGWYPARSASKLEPVKALHYE